MATLSAPQRAAQLRIAQMLRDLIDSYDESSTQLSRASATPLAQRSEHENARVKYLLNEQKLDAIRLATFVSRSVKDADSDVLANLKHPETIARAHSGLPA